MDNLEQDEIDNTISVIESRTDRHLLYISLIITIVMQTRHPWLLENTLIPVSLFGLIFLAKAFLYRWPRFNNQIIRKALFFLVIAFYCFARGLDDKNDYLRFWHGCWHFFGAIGLFYFYNSIDKDRIEKDIVSVPRYKSFGWFEITYELLGINKKFS